MQPGQFRRLLPVNLRSREPQLFFKRLFQVNYVSVLAKNEGNDDPIISRADLTIAAAVSQKFLLPPTRNIRRAPTVPGRIFLVFRRFMTKVGKGQNLSLFYWLISFPDQHPVHDDVCSQGKVRDRKFMLSLDVRNKRILRPAEINLIALLQ